MSYVGSLPPNCFQGTFLFVSYLLGSYSNSHLKKVPYLREKVLCIIVFVCVLFLSH